MQWWVQFSICWVPLIGGGRLHAFLKVVAALMTPGSNSCILVCEVASRRKMGGTSCGHMPWVHLVSPMFVPLPDLFVSSACWENLGSYFMVPPQGSYRPWGHQLNMEQCILGCPNTERTERRWQTSQTTSTGKVTGPCPWCKTTVCPNGYSNPTICQTRPLAWAKPC